MMLNYIHCEQGGCGGNTDKHKLKNNRKEKRKC